jgi:hypothetical protein
MAGPGAPKTGGRQPGTANRVTADVKAMILAALDSVGGQDYLVQQARDNPKAFLSLLGRLIPTQMTGPDDKELLPVQEMTTAELEGRIVALLMRTGISEEQARAVLDMR